MQSDGSIPEASAEQEVSCPKCGSTKFEIKEGSWGPHKGRLECYKCGKFIKWISPDSNQTKKRKLPTPDKTVDKAPDVLAIKRKTLNKKRLEEMCVKLLGESHFAIFFNPFSYRPDYIVDDICSFLEEHGCKIVDRKPSHDNWIPDVIKFSFDEKVFLFHFGMLYAPEIPVLKEPVTCGVIMSRSYNNSEMKALKTILDHNKETTRILEMISSE